MQYYENFFYFLVSLIAYINFVSCSQEDVISPKPFHERMLEVPLWEEVKVHKIVASETTTRSNGSETTVSFLDDEEKEILMVDICEINGLYVVKNHSDKEVMFYLQIEPKGDNSYLTHTYDDGKILRNDNECLVDGQNFLILPQKIHNSDKVITKGWFGSDSKETVSECYKRHMTSKTGRFISVAYSRLMGVAGIAAAHTAGYLSCYVYRN